MINKLERILDGCTIVLIRIATLLLSIAAFCLYAYLPYLITTAPLVVCAVWAAVLMYALNAGVKKQRNYE